MFFIVLIILLLNYFIYFSEVQKFVMLNEELSSEELTNLTIDDYPEGIMFYENMRFPNKIITYSIDSGCGENKKNDSILAFKELEKQTILIFEEVQTKGEIQVICSNIEKPKNQEYFISGEGGPLTIINATERYVIINGTIFLYEKSECEKPVVAIHEILHVLGFKHSTNKKSIMYNYSDCNQVIDDEIIQRINQIYKIPSLPDLLFKNVSAEKQGFYLNFKIEILNEGLSNSENINLSIYVNDKKLTYYEIEILGIGSGKTIRVKNLKIPISTKNITFIIDSENVLPEINNENNLAMLSLNQ
jgi:hypothetical protein